MDGDRITARPRRDDDPEHDPLASLMDAPRETPAEREDEEKKQRHDRRRRRILLGVGIMAALVLVTCGVLYWLHSRHYESTDDAVIDGYVTQVAPQVGGRVERLMFVDNQHVTAGTPLVQLDPHDEQTRLDQAAARRGSAAAQLAQAQAQRSVQQANVAQSQANLAVAEADRLQAQQDSNRFHAIDQHAVSKQQVDSATTNFRSADAKVDAARQAVEGATAQLGASNAQIAAAEASLRAADADVRGAELALSYTVVKAPADGWISSRTVDVGNYVQPGQAMFALVHDQIWVTADFKETQLTLMRPGQPVNISVDAFPAESYHGRIDSIQSGTGSAFSVLPAENATGNYVKVVQRVPVKIVFDDDRVNKVHLSVGMSVTPQVTVR